MCVYLTTTNSRVYNRKKLVVLEVIFGVRLVLRTEDCVPLFAERKKSSRGREGGKEGGREGGRKGGRLEEY